jgi:predicted MFS family arabinose efflux permease
VFGGALTQLGWRWTFFLPVPVALVALLAGMRLVPRSGRPLTTRRAFDLPGAVSLTAGMLLLVYTLVEAPDKGWASARTLGSFVLTAAILGWFVWRELRIDAPLVRLGILRSQSLVRANLAAMTLFGGWVGFQFIATLYLQQLRGWSPIETGLAIFPGGLLVALMAPRVPVLIGRFGVMRLILGGLASTAVAYALFLPIGIDSSYVAAILPTVLLAGLGFALAFAPLNIAATTGVAPMEQGLAGGMLNTSFQFGGALFLAIVTAVNNANVGAGDSAQAMLDGFHPALAVSVIASLLGIIAIGVRVPRRRSEPVVDVVADEEVVEEAA